MTTRSAPPPATGSAPPTAPLDAAAIARIRADFPILHQQVNGKPLVYLDNAATTQKPQSVIDALVHYYTHDNSNVHRGVHELSQRATRAYDEAREKVAAFLHAAESREIVFARGTTEAINLVAQSWGRANVSAGDEILVSHMEHHSNIVPWQLLCEQTGATLRVIPITDAGELCIDELPALITDRTKLIGIVHVSNALGTINPVADVIRIAHERGVPVLVDGAQATAHEAVDVQALDADFYAFSGHKMLAPTGIGGLYAKAALLEAMPPWQGGGDMIRSVSFDGSTWNDVPYKFEAGTPDIAGVVGLGAAVDYLQGIGLSRIAAYEATLLDRATAALADFPGLRLIGTAPHKAAVVSFVIDGPNAAHPQDIGQILDHEGVAIRAGQHCAEPVMHRLGVHSTARASFSFYNTADDVDALVRGLHAVQRIFGT
ncbi:MAG: SufS family cysteine desulfurase [Planctomycetota bacterium]